MGKNNPSVKIIVSIYVTVNRVVTVVWLARSFRWKFLFVSSWYVSIYIFKKKQNKKKSFCNLKLTHCCLRSVKQSRACMCVCIVWGSGWILRLWEIRCLHLARLFLLADYCTVIRATNGNSGRHTSTEHTLTTHCWPYTPKKRPVLHKHKDCSLFSFFFSSTLCLTNIALFYSIRLSVCRAISRGFLWVAVSILKWLRTH